MVDIGSSQTIVKILTNATIKIGTSKIAEAKNVTAQWGNEIKEEIVIGTDMPEYYTGIFRGTISIEHLYCTDLDLATMTDPGDDGQVPETTITEELKDTAATPKTDTWTFTARLNKPEILIKTEGFVDARLTGILTARPTRVQA
jgi:hypothetical protein